MKTTTEQRKLACIFPLYGTDGPRWQAWRAPSWEEIATAEAKDKSEHKQP